MIFGCFGEKVYFANNRGETPTVFKLGGPVSHYYNHLGFWVGHCSDNCGDQNVNIPHPPKRMPKNKPSNDTILNGILVDRNAIVSALTCDNTTTTVCDLQYPVEFYTSTRQTATITAREIDKFDRGDIEKLFDRIHMAHSTDHRSVTMFDFWYIDRKVFIDTIRDAAEGNYEGINDKWTKYTVGKPNIAIGTVDDLATFTFENMLASAKPINSLVAGAAIAIHADDVTPLEVTGPNEVESE